MSTPRGENTRERLLIAARDAVVELGWSRTTSRAVAERAGVNLALINYHFGSKDELLLSSFEAAMEELIAVVGDAVPRSLDELEAMVNEFVDGVADSPQARMIFEATMRAPYDSSVAAAAHRQLETFRQLIRTTLEAAHKNGALHPSADPAQLSVALAALLDGLFLHALIDPELDISPALSAVFALLRPT